MSSGLLIRCVDLLLSRGEVKRGLGLFVSCGKHRQAIDKCASNGIQITEELAELLTPPVVKEKVGRKEREEEEKKLREEDRLEVIRLLAKLLKKQGSYELASMKYTQSGDRMKALKCLMQGGLSRKVITYTTTCRDKDMYVLSSNYLQQVYFNAILQEEEEEDEDESEEKGGEGTYGSQGKVEEGKASSKKEKEKENEFIQKSIVGFCKRAKAYDQLAAFYGHLAQIEMDEFRDYEKALEALKEALACFSKSRTPDQAQVTTFQLRIQAVQKFVDARLCLVRQNFQEMVSICEELIQEQEVYGDENIRIGDVFALLVEQLHARGDMEAALRYVRQMQEKKIPLEPYLEEDVVSDIGQANRVYLSYGNEREQDQGHREQREGNAKLRDEDEDDDDEIEDGFYGENSKRSDEDDYEYYYRK